MKRFEDDGADDSDNETDPEQLLNEWLGELDSLTVVSRLKYLILSRVSNTFFSFSIYENLRISLSPEAKTLTYLLQASNMKTHLR